MVESVNVIGRGRVGSAIAARLEERNLLVERDAEVTLLCVPDTAIRDVAQGQSLGPGWIGHVSGATPLSALDPHTRRFSLHPLQTFTRARGPEQLDGAWAAVTAESDEGRALGFELAVVAQRDTALVEPSGQRRADAAATDHVDAFDHLSSSSVADAGQAEV